MSRQPVRIQSPLAFIVLRHRVGVIAFAAILISACAGCSREPPKTVALIAVDKTSAPEAQLAVMQLGASQVPAGLVIEFDEALTNLEKKCSQTRSSSPSLVDVAVDGVRAAHKAGHELTHLEVLRTLESNIHENADMRVDCTAIETLLLEPSGLKMQ